MSALARIDSCGGNGRACSLDGRLRRRGSLQLLCRRVWRGRRLPRVLQPAREKSRVSMCEVAQQLLPVTHRCVRARLNQRSLWREGDAAAAHGLPRSLHAHGGRPATVLSKRRQHL